MKRIIVFLVFMSQLMMFGQQNEDQFSPHLPQIVPVSPEAASLGKFGDLPINLSIGKLDFTIPLYTIEIGDFSYPIYLQYNNLGLMPDEDPSIVGFGWTLSAEGMISRQVRGLNDEKSGRGYLDQGILMHQHQNEYPYSQYWKDLFHESLLGTMDVEPDKFLINIGGLSGNFLFNEKGEPIIYPFKNYKISYERVSDRILKFNMIDDHGNHYLFSTIESNINDNPQVLRPIVTWKLDTIRIANSTKLITFDYLESDISHLYRKVTHSEVRHQGASILLDLFPTVSHHITTSIITQKLIHHIYFPKGKIEFITNTVPSNSYANNKYYLDKIIVYKGDSNVGYQILKTFQFVYNNLISNYRLLKEVQLYDTNNNQQPFYRFSYYDEDNVPNTIHYANQDTWGYYNGTTNQDLISQESNRSVDFTSTRLGALDSIHYPTGGSTKIKYELNKIDFLNSTFQYFGQCFSKPLNKSLSVYASEIEHGIDYLKSDTLTFNCDQTIRVTFFVSVDGTSGMSEAEVNMDVINGQAHCDPNSGCSESCSMSELVTQEQGVSSTKQSSHISYFDVSAGTTIVFNARVLGRSDHTALITVNYSDNCDEDIEVGGLRIKETQDITKAGVIKTEHYQYIDENGKSSGRLCYLPNPVDRIDCNAMTSSGIVRSSVLKFYATSQLPMVGFQGSTTLYDRVITYTNESNNGKIINEFNNNTNIVASQGYPTDFNNYKNGRLKSKQFYKKKAGDFELVNKKNFNNTILHLNPIPNTLIGEPFSRGFYLHITGYVWNGFSNEYEYSSMPYDYLKEKLINSSQQEINYFSTGNLEKLTDYTYDNQRGYLKEQTTTDSDGKQIKVTNVYPYEVTNVNSLGTGNQAISPDDLSAYQNLTQKNIIAKPVQVEKEIRNNGQITKQKLRTTYKQVLNTDFTLPHKVSVLNETNGTNSSFEPRVIYHNYDPYGNPIEVSKADGTHIYYIYGYQHTKPIAKIVNFKQAQAQSLQAQIAAAITASDNDEDAASEDALRTALDNLRQALPDNTQVTTYTYDPLIGVTSITDPKGDTQYYIYDSFNRLKYIKDKNGHILKEYEYHYKQ